MPLYRLQPVEALTKPPKDGCPGGAFEERSLVMGTASHYMTEARRQRKTVLFGKCGTEGCSFASTPFTVINCHSNMASSSLSLNPIKLASQIQQMGDARTRDYPVVMNPLFVFPLTIFYVYFVKVLGPRWMKNREPFQILNLVRVYNLLMVLLNARFCYIVVFHAYYPRRRYSLWCQGVTGKMDDELAYYYRTGWWYVAVRYADFLDTVFFIMRKKFNQVTHLHVIHHKYLWWKKYLTRIQIIQNVVFMSHMAIPLFVDCGFPRYLIWVANAQTFLVMCLFINFYIHSYIKRRGTPKLEADQATAKEKAHGVTNGKQD
ncbi:hypothetical protein HPB51_015358 [Rhipicephalus microplus]|uniref:Elongation of very long chain fatty acids protein n=1 Tax=Rhipicephalus microplus TaxID=6941 RepID=A0A9J6DVS7_RHIMP|nr:hypothetical protein HPB51_015358 [Rhipicephalus microplus]